MKFLLEDYKPQNDTVLVKPVPKEGILLVSKQKHDFEHYEVISLPDVVAEELNAKRGDIVVAHTSVVKDFMDICQFVNSKDIFAVISKDDLKQHIDGEHH